MFELLTSVYKMLRYNRARVSLCSVVDCTTIVPSGRKCLVLHCPVRNYSVALSYRINVLLAPTRKTYGLCQSPTELMLAKARTILGDPRHPI